MRLKIRQPDLSYSIEIKQLPSKQVFLFTLKKQSKNFLVPVKILNLEIQPENVEFFRLLTDNSNFDNDVYYYPSVKAREITQTENFQKIKIGSEQLRAIQEPRDEEA